MATVNFIKYKKQSAGALSGVTRYISQEEKIRDMDGRQLVSGQNCTPQLADQEFQATRDACRKDSPVWFYHYVQSFSPDEVITGEQAHQLAKEFAARAWPDSEVLIATHLDAEHIHSHFVVNAVCGETGKMPAGSESPLQPATAVGRAVSGAWIRCLTTAEEKTDPGHGHPGVPLRRKGRELGVPADEHHRPVHAVRRNLRGIHLPDGERGLPGALDGGSEEYHLHHAGGDEVPGRPAPRNKVHQGGHGT